MLILMQKQPLEVFYKKAVLRNFAILTGKYLCWNPAFNKVVGLQACKLEKEIPTQVFSGEYCEIFKNIYFQEYLRMAVSINGYFTTSLTP